MNNQTSKILTVVLNNRVVCADTNLKSLREQFLKIEPTFWKYDRLALRLRKSDKTIFFVEDKEYHIQITKRNEDS